MARKQATEATEATEGVAPEAAEVPTGNAAILSSIKKMNMAELVAQYNLIVPSEEAKTEAELGSEIKARNAIKKLLGVSFVFPRSPKSGIGEFAKGLILEGNANGAVLAAVKEQFPDAKTTMGCIGYYRAKLVAAGKLNKGDMGTAAEEAAGDAVEEQEAA